MELTPRNRWMASFAAVVLYALTFLLFYERLQEATLPLTLVPIIVVSWLHGIPGALTIGMGIVLLDVVLFTAVGDLGAMSTPISIIGHAMIVVAALLTGRFSQIAATQRQYLEERIRLMEDLEEGESRYRTLFEQAGDAVFIVRLKAGQGAEFWDCNQSTLTLFGCETHDQIIGRSPAEFSPERQPDGTPSVEKIAALAEASLSGERQVFEWQHQRADGSRFWVEVSLTPVAIGPDPALLAVVRDVGDRKRAEEDRARAEQQLRQSQKMEALGVLAGGVAHEFNNLLVPVLGHIDLLRAKDLIEDPEDQSHLDVIERAGLRAAELVRQMLAYSRQSHSERRPVYLEETVNEVVQLIEHTLPQNITVRAAVDSGLPGVWGTATELTQVLLNLCVNASHAMVDGGDLTIRVRDAGLRTFTQSDHRDLHGHFLCLSVEDTGSGMDADVMAHIFDPFFTTKAVGSGSGLGLSVVHGIVEQHGGFVDVSSHPGEGSRFDVYLPVAAADSGTEPEEMVEADQIRNDPAAVRARLLVVDDEPMVLDLAVQSLQTLGYEVEGFHDAAALLDAFRADPDGFDLLVTDQGMPGITGRELAARIKEVRPDFPVILSSGYGDVLAGNGEIDGAVDRILAKPYRLSALQELIATLLPSRVE